MVTDRGCGVGGGGRHVSESAWRAREDAWRLQGRLRPVRVTVLQRRAVRPRHTDLCLWAVACSLLTLDALIADDGTLDDSSILQSVESSSCILVSSQRFDAAASGYAPADMRAFVGSPRHCIIKAGFDGTDETRRFALDEVDALRGGGGERRRFAWGEAGACEARDCRETRRCVWGERAHATGTASDGALSGVRRTHTAGGTASDGVPAASSSESDIVMVVEAAGTARCRPLAAPAVCLGFHARVSMDGMQFSVRTIFGG